MGIVKTPLDATIKTLNRITSLALRGQDKKWTLGMYNYYITKLGEQVTTDEDRDIVKADLDSRIVEVLTDDYYSEHLNLTIVELTLITET